MIKKVHHSLRHLKWILPLLLIVISIIIINIPASYLVNKIEKAARYKLRLLNPTGTIWNGSAYIALSYGSADKKPVTLPTPITWKISISNILNASINIKHENIMQEFKIYPLKKRISELQIEDLPLDFFSGLQGALSSLDLGGKVNINIPEGLIENIESTQINISIIDIYRKEDPNLILGSYNIKSGDVDNKFDVDTISGVLKITGQGTINPFGFSGEAVADEIFAPRLVPFLRTIGYEQDGKTIIQF